MVFLSVISLVVPVVVVVVVFCSFFFFPTKQLSCKVSFGNLKSILSARFSIPVLSNQVLWTLLSLWANCISSLCSDASLFSFPFRTPTSFLLLLKLACLCVEREGCKEDFMFGQRGAGIQHGTRWLPNHQPRGHESAQNN